MATELVDIVYKDIKTGTEYYWYTFCTEYIFKSEIMIDSNLLSKMTEQSTLSVISTAEVYLMNICENTAMALRSHLKCVFKSQNILSVGDFDPTLFGIMKILPLRNVIHTLSNYLDMRDFQDTAQIVMLFYKYEKPLHNVGQSEDFFDGYNSDHSNIDGNPIIPSKKRYRTNSDSTLSLDEIYANDYAQLIISEDKKLTEKNYQTSINHQYKNINSFDMFPSEPDLDELDLA